MHRKVLYIKKNLIRPGVEGRVVQAYPLSHVFSDREKAQDGYTVIFGNFQCDLSEDEYSLCNIGRRKVDNVDNPSGVIPVG